MAWWSDKLSLGGLQDIAGAVNKISESVKNMEKNFDSALGLEAEKRDDDEGKPYLHALPPLLLTHPSPPPHFLSLCPGCIGALLRTRVLNLKLLWSCW